MQKVCCKCHKGYDTTEFYKDPLNSDGYKKACKICYRKTYSTKSNKRKSPTKHWLNTIKNRAKQNRLAFNLTVEDLVIPHVCPVLGILLVRTSTQTDNSPSVDRIVPSLGYVKGNVCIISLRANRLKSCATADELQKLFEYVKKNSPTK